jgi:hypothetical protein
VASAGRSYTREEVQAILSRALEGAHSQGDALSHDDLLAIARELGLPESAIDAAAVDIDLELAVKRAVEERVLARRRGFMSHLFSYLLVNAFLFAINFLAGGPWWFVWPLLGWGLGLAFHARGALLPDRPAIAAKARKRIAKEREREARKARRQQGTGDIEAAVQDVVAGALGVVADAIHDSRGRTSRSPRPPQVRVSKGTSSVAPGPRIVDAEYEEIAEDEAQGARRADRRSR